VVYLSRSGSGLTSTASASSPLSLSLNYNFPETILREGEREIRRQLMWVGFETLLL